MAWNEYFCFNIVTREQRNEFRVGIQYVEFFASEERLCSMQLVTAVNFLSSCVLNVIIARKVFCILCSYKCSALCIFFQFLFRKS